MLTRPPTLLSCSPIVARSLVIVVTLAILAGGCGGDRGGATSTGASATTPGTTAGTTLSGAAARFAAIADRACTRARGAAPPRPPRTADDLGAYVRSQAVAAQRVAGALAGVTPPPSERAGLAALRRSYGALLAAYSAALPAPDEKARKRVADAEAAAGRLAAAAGIAACAPSAPAG